MDSVLSLRLLSLGMRFFGLNVYVVVASIWAVTGAYWCLLVPCAVSGARWAALRGMRSHPGAGSLHRAWGTLALSALRLGTAGAEARLGFCRKRCIYWYGDSHQGNLRVVSFLIHSSRILAILLNKSWRNESFNCSFCLLLKMLLKSASVHEDIRNDWFFFSVRLQLNPLLSCVEFCRKLKIVS